jgi:WXXGXW repeat (2 copies)
VQIRMSSLAIPVFVSLVGSAAAVAQPVQLVTPAPVQYGQSTVIIAPNPPPPPRVETVPPPPSAEAQVMYWQQGHWMWNGANWEWAAGQYVQRPAPQAVWEPGHWSQQPSGGYVWVDGHWQG